MLSGLASGLTEILIDGSSNQLESSTGVDARAYSYDAAGNITNDGMRSFTYNDAGRMASATKAGTTTTYALNGRGQRVRKTTSSASVHFVYDEAGHLLGEYDSSGNLMQETVWLGDIPVATLRPNGGSGVNVFYVHTDHLNTPRRISRPSDNVVVWRWDSEPFGAASASSDPDGDSNVFTYNLRFPGQYFDAESGLYYNYYRDGYDAATGRYTQSDPIGLQGGTNTYAYSGGYPLGAADPLGLDPLRRPVPHPSPGLTPEPNVRPMPPGLAPPANEPSFRPRPRPGAGLSLCVALPELCVIGGALLPSSIGEEWPDAANDPNFGDRECPPDCREYRTALNRMYQVIMALERRLGMPEGTHIEWERFKKYVGRYEKQCGPYTPPPSIEDVYTK